MVVERIICCKKKVKHVYNWHKFYSIRSWNGTKKVEFTIIECIIFDMKTSINQSAINNNLCKKENKMIKNDRGVGSTLNLIG